MKTTLNGLPTEMKQTITNIETSFKSDYETHRVVVVFNPMKTKYNGTIEAVVFFGNENESGWRVKDGVGNKRNEVRQQVADRHGININLVRGQALYSRLQSCGNGMAKDVNSGGFVKLH